METSILKKAGEFLLERSRCRQWYRCVTGMAAVVVFVTVYALILPAITLEKDALCGQEEHTHTEDCYEEVLTCDQENEAETDAVSEETESSGASEAETHEHTGDCYEKVLICGKEEHMHIEKCYEEQTVPDEQEEHVHTEICYDGDGNPACQEEEPEEEEEKEPAEERREEEEMTVFCGIKAHEHTADCYDSDGEPVCGMEEHIHTDKCRDKQMASDEQEEHIHTDACYDEDGNLMCGEEEMEEDGGEEPAVFCGMEVHTHTADCYNSDGEQICSLEEHEHTEACYGEALLMLAEADEAEWIEVSSGEDLGNAMAKVQQGGQIAVRIMDNFETSQTYEILGTGNALSADAESGSEGRTTVVLDLNGHTVTRKDAYLFRINGGELTVLDQSESANDPSAVTVSEADAGEPGTASYDAGMKTLTYYFTENSSDTDAAEIVRKRVDADLSGVGAIEGSGADGLLYVENGGILNIEGGRFTNTGGNHALVAAWTGDGSKGSTINISGGYVCGSGNGDKGGGIYFGGGDLTISGGVIAANRAKGNGGGICAEVNGNVVMTGGVISQNTATGQGGGLYVKGRFEMTGGEIVGNHADRDGGGVCVEGQLTVEKSVIAQNSSGSSGGGIAAWSGSEKYSLSGNQIIGNTALVQGGGMYIDGMLTVANSTIKGNTALRSGAVGNGGGIRLNGGKNCLEVTNSIISDNKADSGGGVHADGKVIFCSGTVQGNSAEKASGGGIYAGGGLTFEDGTVSQNTAAENGGGMYVGGSLFFTKGTVSSNEAVRYGGGIYAAGQGRSEFRIEGGTITGNRTTMSVVGENESGNNVAREGTAESGGGGIYVKSSTFVFEDGEVSGNTASLTGGGMFIYDTEFTMSGGTIKENTVVRGEGGGIRFCADSDGLIQAAEGKQIGITGNRTDTTHDWGGGGIFVSQDGRLRIYNSLVTENTAGGFGGGVGGCSTGRLDLSADEGTAIYGNSANGEIMSTTTKKQEDRIAKNDSRFMYGGYYQDYFCAYVSRVSGSMLGGGDYDWVGSRDYQPVRIRYGEVASASQMMGLTAHPSQSAREAAAEKAGVKICENYSNTHGGGIMSNGILVLGGEKPQRFDVGLRIDAKKRFADEQDNPYPLDPGQFQFVLLDPEKAGLRYDSQTGKIAFDPESMVIDPVGNDADGDIFFFLSYTHKGEYTYYMLEKAEDVSEIQYDTAVYKIKVMVEEQEAGDAMALIVSDVQAEILEDLKSLPDPEAQNWQSCGVSLENPGSTVKACTAKILRPNQEYTFLNTGSKPLYFRIRKQDSEDKKALINVEFTLEEAKSGQIVSRRTGSDGFIAFPVEKGKSYLLRETEPLAGYLGAGPWRVAVDNVGKITLSQASSDQEGGSGTPIEATGLEEPDYYYIIENAPRTFALPDTGGSGTRPYAAAGIVLLLGSGLLYRKKCREGGHAS